VAISGTAVGAGMALWGGGCTALLNIDRFSVAQAGGAETGGGDAEPAGLYQDLVFTLTSMTPHKNHYFEYRVVAVNSNTIIARGAVENCGFGTISAAGIDVPLTAPRAIPNTGTGPLRVDFFAETRANTHVFLEPDPSLPLDSDAAASPSFLIKDHSWQVLPPLVDTIIAGPLPDGGTSLAHEDGKIQIYFVHNPDLVDIDINPITGQYNPPTGVGGDVSFSLSGLDKYANDLLELRVYDSSFTVGTTSTKGSPTQNVGLYRFPILSPSFGGGFKGMPPLVRGAGSSFPGIVGVIDQTTNYVVDVYIDANGNGVYDNPAMPNGDLGWRLYLTSDANGNLSIKFDATESGGNVDVGPP